MKYTRIVASELGEFLIVIIVTVAETFLFIENVMP